ncbi:glycoside hydrolase family 65 protein [Streptomyces telluris]|uniref:Glycoside hydrolase family 65 protein n=2 Tax=Streptomyces telluris TaxID=2720021 RepID=A0A9X2LG38_9ACTN|nr:glycosyl hydrolase family 65 protein [Streptomyces telluris]MCQ8770528.1 glycoside hydrolase family 65 protein [Streptomyces telluris]
MGEWTWEYEGYDPAEERLRETLHTLGNGYFATRGAAPECRGGLVHCPGTYAAGCYDRLVSSVVGRQVENEDLVNLPNWLLLRFRLLYPDGSPGPWFTPDRCETAGYRQVLDLRGGTLTRSFRYLAADGRVLRVEQCRLVHMGDPHIGALRTAFAAEGWSGRIEVEAGLDGDVINANVHRYRALDRRHLAGVHTGVAEPDTVWLRCRTRTSDIGIGMAQRAEADGPPPVAARLRAVGHRAFHHFEFAVSDKQPAAVVKTVALHTSRDWAISDPLGAAVERVGRAPAFASLLHSHAVAWRQLWRRSELEVPGEAGHVLRLHHFHVLQTLSPHTAGLDAGVPARGLHGEAYRGHVFWDELFVLPYLDLRLPEVARSLLDYRYRRLPQAQWAAGQDGRTGAMYPWQSGSDGRDESQRVHLNPRSGRWVPDLTRLQRHVGSAIAYNIWQYCQATGDTRYLQTKGADMLLQIARFWAGSAVSDPAGDRYRIRGVVGPDEYHDAYPGADRPGIDDNAYTNVMAAWVLTRALDLVRSLPARRRQELVECGGLDIGELPLWEQVSRRLVVPLHEGVISQFDGYGELAELDWGRYRERYGDIRRLDRILEAEGDAVNRYQVSKQADVLMLGYLFSPAELASMFQRLGYRFTDELWQRTVDYYLRRTSHGSTLSEVVHGWVLARARRADAWRYCREALESDVADLQGGTTPEGIHLGAMAGTLDLVQRGLTGMETREDALWLDPVVLPELSEFAFTLRYRGHWGIGIRVRGDELTVSVPESEGSAVRIVLPDRSLTVLPGDATSVRLSGRQDG